MIPMRDGVKLYTAVWTPSGTPGPLPFLGALGRALFLAHINPDAPFEQRSPELRGSVERRPVDHRS